MRRWILFLLLARAVGIPAFAPQTAVLPPTSTELTEPTKPTAAQNLTLPSRTEQTMDVSTPFPTVAPPPDDMADARRHMVEKQMRPRDITDERVLAVMEKVPRHEFVAPETLSQAYADHPLPIGYGQTISQPYIVALMTQMLNLEPGDKVLDICTGSGDQAAVLA